MNRDGAACLMSAQSSLKRMMGKSLSCRGTLIMQCVLEYHDLQL